MKKFILKSIITITATALFILIQSAAAFAFYADVPETHEYYNSINTLNSLGRLPVEDYNLFHPDDRLKKGELYKLVLTYGMADISQEIDLPYSDISSDSPYAKYIQTAIDTQILKPTSTLFGLNRKITKKVALTTMFGSLGLGGNYFFPKVDFPFTDMDADSDIAPLAFKASQLKILEKSDPKLFLKNKKITKAEAVDYLYKIKQAGQSSISITLTTNGNGTNGINATATQKELLDNKSFLTLLDVWSSLNEKFLYKDQLKDQDLIFGAIKGMVSEATEKDKYTTFEAPSEKSAILDNLSTQYEGVGIIIEMIDNKVTVVSPFKDSPAEKAGIKAKDVIIKVDGQSVKDLQLNDVSKKIKGPAKSEVKLTISRSDQEMEFTIIREFIMVKSVTQKILTTTSGKTVGYLDLLTFGEGTYDEFLTAAKDLIKQNLAGLIIDLRNNPGGYVDVAVNIISLFTDEVKTVVTMESGDKQTETYKTNGNGLLKNYKVIILINEGSASASEIVAGALKDYQIATLIGKKSFGKGTAQELKTYKDGSVFKYTISNWLTPNGTKINGTGITPDKIVENAASSDDQLNAALTEFN